MTRGRPKADTPAWECHIHLRLRTGQDDDLIAFLAGIPARKRSAAIKSVLRSGWMGPKAAQDSTPEDELLAAVDDFLK